MKARIPAATFEWAARAMYKMLKANKGKAEGESKAPLIPSTRAIQLLKKNLQNSHRKTENVKP